MQKVYNQMVADRDKIQRINEANRPLSSQEVDYFKGVVGEEAVKAYETATNAGAVASAKRQLLNQANTLLTEEAKQKFRTKRMAVPTAAQLEAMQSMVESADSGPFMGNNIDNDDYPALAYELARRANAGEDVMSVAKVREVYDEMKGETASAPAPAEESNQSELDAVNQAIIDIQRQLEAEG